MHGWLHTARFLTTAPQLEHLPDLTVPEIAFVGRSNAGKSTAINTLTRQRQLAFASRTPARSEGTNIIRPQDFKVSYASGPGRAPTSTSASSTSSR